jgi:hypothetical protein
MPPRRSARVADASARAADPRRARIVAAAQHAAPALAPLPLALVLVIFSLLPVDTRMRCAEVCRSWRAALEERSLWIRLDFLSGVSPTCVVTDALLHAAVARARGELVSLSVGDCAGVTSDALLAAVTANGGALRELRMSSNWSRDHEGSAPLRRDALEALIYAAQRLAVCEADVECDDLTLARRLLRNEPPFGPLRVRTFFFHPAESERDEAAVLALAADLASHAHLRRLQLYGAPLNTAAALDAVVDAALTRQLTSVRLHWCDLSPESAPALARLIGGGTLAELDLYDAGQQLFDVPAALALGNALRANSTLIAVYLEDVALWREPAAATALLGALTGHPSLRSLNISDNQVAPANQQEAGAALGALIAANAPALHEVNLHNCLLGDAGLRPLFDALPANTHLRTVYCCANALSDAFMRDTLLPAVRANASLHELYPAAHPLSDAAQEAVTLVLRRADAA